MKQVDKNENVAFSIWEIVTQNLLFAPLQKINNIPGSYMLFEYISDDEDGIFPNVRDYIDLTYKMENEGTVAYLNWLTNNNNEHQCGSYTLIRDCLYTSNGLLKFENPIKIIVAHLNDKPIFIEATLIHGSFSHKWFWNKKARRQNEVANSFEVFFDCKKYELI